MEDYNKEKRLSIIIPAYNAERYLDRCIESCECQDIGIDDYEVIIVDDGSTDKTLQIAEALSKKYLNICVYTQVNKGQSVARNMALDVAVGKYVMFVDADDFLIEKSIGQVLVLAENNQLEVCSFLLKVMKGGGGFFLGSLHGFPLNTVFAAEHIVLKGIQPASVCCAIYSRTFLNKFGLRFYSGILHQDVEFTTKVYALVSRILFTDIVCYVYEYNPTSSTRDRAYTKLRRSLLDNAVVAHSIQQFADTSKDISANIRKNLRKRVCSNLVGAVLYFLRAKDKNIRRIGLDFLEHARTLGIYPIKGRALSWKTSFIKFLLNNDILVRVLLKRG